MIARRASKACGVLLAMACLNGCVAAAIPALAGAAIVRTETNQNDNGGASQSKTNVASIVEASAMSDAEGLTQPNPALASKSVIFGPAPAPLASTQDTTAVLHDGYAALFDYVESNTLDSGPTGGLTSAVLANPSALDGKRAQCRVQTPTVLVDLDPHSQPSVVAERSAVSSKLGERLSVLRGAGIDIAWISERTAAEAGDIRRELKRAGIDPDGKDQLILMRYPGDRKQTRRSDLAKSSCIIAIAGDNREDFDELYEYLVKPDSALALELLIGQGWFLAPALLPTGEP